MSLRTLRYKSPLVDIRASGLLSRQAPLPVGQRVLLAETCEELQSVFDELHTLRAHLAQRNAALSMEGERRERPSHHTPDGFKDQFVYELLHGTLTDEGAIVRDAKILGMDLSQPRAVILIDASDYILAADQSGALPADGQVRARAQMIIRSVVRFFHLLSEAICAYLGDGRVAVLKASNTKNLAVWADNEPAGETVNQSWANLAALKRAGGELAEQLRNETGAAITVGIGRHHPGIKGLARSYEDAHAALSLGMRFHGPNGIHCLDSLGVTAFVCLADEATKTDLAAYLLSPLESEPELVETLHVFFETNCCPSVAAPKLSIHRNTLSYRLDKIAALTGLDPRRFDDAVQIRLALVLKGGNR